MIINNKNSIIEVNKEDQMLMEIENFSQGKIKRQNEKVNQSKESPYHKSLVVQYSQT